MGNVGQTGFYRVNYEQPQWDQLTNQLDQDHMVSKLDFTELMDVLVCVSYISVVPSLTL